MVRLYSRKPGSRRYKDYTPEVLAQAVNDVENGLLSIREASVKYGVSKSTISRKLLHQNEGLPGHPTVFSPHEEEAIVTHVTTVADWGFPINLLELRLLGKLYLQRAGKSIQCFTNNTPGKEWAVSFVARHSAKLTRRVCQNIKVSRSKVDADTINQFFDNLSSTVASIPVKNIVNYDETNLTDNPRSAKFIFKRGARHPERVMNATKSATSIMFAGTASGELLVPYVVYKAESLWETWREGGPRGCRYNRSKSGWLDAVCFNDWFDTVIVPWARKIDGKKVVIGDNISSHFTSSVLQTCEKMNIAFVCLPPNATNMMQPLDVAVYGPMKKAWRAILTAWKEGAGRTRASLPKDKFPTLLSQLMTKLQPNIKQNLQSGFRACGIAPLDRQQVLKKLPGQTTGNEGDTGATVSAAVIDMLDKLRYGDKEQGVRRTGTRCKVNVKPGQSVGAAASTSDDGPSCTVKRRRTKADISTAVSESDVESSDTSSEDTNATDNETTSTLHQLRI